jgi:ribosomal protein S18 acetylase RimI-like enzyme
LVEILVEYSQEVLIDAIQENWWEWLKITAETPYLSYLETPEYTIVLYHSDGKTDQGWCLRLNTSPERCEAAVDDVFAIFEKHELPVMIMFTPKSGPEQIGMLLEDRGLTRIVSNIPTMAAELQKLKQERPNPEERITDNAGMDLFKDIYHKGWGDHWGNLDHNVNSIKMLGNEPDFPVRSYVGYLNGEPVATSQLTLLSGVAGLWSVVVPPEHRRKGLGTAMTLDTLRMAIPEGYRFGVLWPSDMSVNLYRRIGFEGLFNVVTYMETREH